MFVDRTEFERKASSGGFIEWAVFLGNYYGTPVPEPPPGFDVLLEIDLQGASQVRRRDPEAVVLLLLPPSPEVQVERLRHRGDSDEEIARRIAKGAEEEAIGRSMADHVIVNDTLERAVAEAARIIEEHRW